MIEVGATLRLLVGLDVPDDQGSPHGSPTPRVCAYPGRDFCCHFSCLDWPDVFLLSIFGQQTLIGLRVPPMPAAQSAILALVTMGAAVSPFCGAAGVLNRQDA